MIVRRCLSGLGRRARSPLSAGTVSPRRTVPPHIIRPPYAETGKVPPSPPHVTVLPGERLQGMREACVLARRMLELACSLAKPGVTTDSIDAVVHDEIVEAGAYPSPLNYSGFPKSLCSSVNEVVCHAIPDSRPLEDGDIVSFDVSLFLNGCHGDNCATVCVGDVDDEGKRLVRATQEALDAGISVCKPGACLTEIGAAVEDVAVSHGFESVRKYCGHGIGEDFHALPFVQHFRNDYEMELVPGMIFTIEPSLTEGSEATYTWSDGWTVATLDGGRAAQFEHVVLITESGCEILTISDLKTQEKKYISYS